MANWRGTTENDYWMERAVQEIRSTYGVEARPKPKSLLKFGRISALGTSDETVWQRGGVETYIATNGIDTISSSDNGDTQSVTVEGHTIDENGDFTFVVQTRALTGQTKAVLATPLARATRIYNNDSTGFAGTVYVYEDDTVTNGVPQTTAKTHLQTSGSNNQSLKAATTISSVDYWAISTLYGAVSKKTSATVDFKFQVREKNKVFRTRVPGSAASNGGNLTVELRPYLIVPANADFRIQAAASTTNVDCVAWANGQLLILSTPST